MLLDKDGGLTLDPENIGGAQLTVNGNFQLNDGTQTNGDVLVSDASGNASWQTLDKTALIDNDNDTQIQVEEGTDDDTIRFDTAGTEHFTMSNGRLGVLNTGESVFIGNSAGANDDLSGNQNTAIGNNALQSGTTGSQNTAVGRSALTTNVTGNNNTALGRNALFTSTGNGNTAVGSVNASALSTGNNNTSVGSFNFQNNADGTNNTIVGAYAMRFATTGNNNTVLGRAAGINATGSGNVFLGYESGSNETGDNKLYIENSNSTIPLVYGEFNNDLLRVNGTLDINNAYQFPITDGTANQILSTNGAGIVTWNTIDKTGLIDNDNDTQIQVEEGTDDDTIRFDTAGTEYFTMSNGRLGVLNTGESVFIGNSAGANDDLSGNQNTAVGNNALQSGTTGSQNTAVGRSALTTNVTGNNNTALGRNALFTSTGNGNTAVGSVNASALSTGNNNTTVGSFNLQNNADGTNNTVVGAYAMRFGTTGNNNTVLGRAAGINATGSGNVFLGYESGANETGDNKLYLENSNSATPLVYGEFDNDLLRVNGTLDINNAYQFPIVDGTANQVLSTDGAGAVTWNTIDKTDLVDADGDTRVQVEESADDDIIRFDLAGQETFRMENGRLEVLGNGNSVFIGRNAGDNDDQSSNRNVFIGDNTGRYTTTGNLNVALGSNALEENTTGSQNVVLGASSGFNNLTGTENTYLGAAAGFSNIAGAENVMIGRYSGANATGSNNVFLGNSSGRYETGDNKLYIDNSDTTSPLIYGEFDNDFFRINGTLDINNAYQLPIVDGTANQVLSTDGVGAVTWNTIDKTGLTDNDNDTKIQVEETTDDDLIRFDIAGTEYFRMNEGRIDILNTGNSVFIGENAGANDDFSSNSNTGIGAEALTNNTDGFNNTSIGRRSMRDNVGGDANTAVGINALGNNVNANENTAVGAYALEDNESGIDNTSSGYASLANNVSGNRNTALGSEAGNSLTSGQQNIFLGANAGSNGNGNGNIMLGYSSGANELGSNKLYIENSNSATPLIYGEFDTNLFRVNGTLDVNNAYQFPTVDGTTSQVLTTNGSCAVSWASLPTDNDTSASNELITAFALSGNNLSLTEAGTTRTVDLSAFSGGNDNLGNHTATTNIETNGNYISNDGDNEGIYIDGNGQVGIGTNSPNALAEISSGTDGDAVLLLSSDTDNNNENDNPEIRFAQDGGAQTSFIGVEGDADSRSPGTIGNALMIGSENLITPVQFITNDQTRMTILTDGNVGIGTNAPTFELEVEGDSRVNDNIYFGTSGAYLGGNNQGGSIELGPTNNAGGQTPFVDFHYGIGATEDFNFRVINDADHQLSFRYDNVHPMRITSTGIDIFDNYTLPSTDGTTGQVMTTDGAGNVSWTTVVTGGNDNLGNHTAITNIETNGNYISNDGDNEGIYIDGNGQVGIGTNTPSVLTEISSGTDGDAVLLLSADTDNNNESDNPEIRFAQDGGAQTSFIGVEGLGGTRSTGTIDNALMLGSENLITPLQFITNDETRMTLLTNGNVGIGTNAPTYELEVEGDSRVNDNLYFGTSGAFLGGNNQGGSIELGPTNSAGGEVPFVDFHYGIGAAEDFNFRIINDADHQLSFRYNNIHPMRISSTGISVFDNYTLPTTDGTNGQVLTTNGAGVTSWTTASGGSGSSDEITDADNDTKIQVEESTDEDMIRFDLEGTERFVMTDGRLEVKNNNENIAIGENAGAGLNTGGAEGNTFIGDDTGLSTANGSYNVAVGQNALYFNNAVSLPIEASNNSAVGVSAMQSNTIGSSNTSMGRNSMISNTTGSFNTAIGDSSMFGNTTGENNTALGYFAQYNFSLTNLSNIVAIGYNSEASASNSARIGDVNMTSIGGYANWTNLSDGRFKTNVKEDVVGLDFIMKLRPVSYNIDLEALAKFKKTPENIRLKNAEVLKSNEIQTGFIAQEVERAAQETAFDFHGIDKPKNENSHYGLRYAEFVVPLVKAMQEQQTIIETQENKLEMQESTIKNLLDGTEKLEKEHELLKQKVEQLELLYKKLGVQKSE